MSDEGGWHVYNAEAEHTHECICGTWIHDDESCMEGRESLCPWCNEEEKP